MIESGAGGEGDICPVLVGDSLQFVIQPSVAGPHFGGEFLTQNLRASSFFNATKIISSGRDCQGEGTPTGMCDQLVVSATPISGTGNFSVRYVPAAASGEQPINVDVIYGKGNVHCGGVCQL